MNSKFGIEDLSIEGVKLITPFYAEDSRGHFLKSIERDVYKSWGLDADIFEEFETASQAGVIRGMHFQFDDPQTKIVRVINGRINDVILDLRKESPTFGKYIVVELSGENHKIVWIPAGCAHGFEVLSEEGAVMSYTCVGKYIYEKDTGIYYADPDLDIRWSIKDPLVSEKDKNLMSFQTFIDEHGSL